MYAFFYDAKLAHKIRISNIVSLCTFWVLQTGRNLSGSRNIFQVKHCLDIGVNINSVWLIFTSLKL
jgi:hypothetical protein